MIPEVEGTSANDSWYKGPDNYINNLPGLLLRWREEQVALVGDIRKMFNSVHLEEAEQHCHRFLWRDMEISRDPDIYVMTRVNIGDRPAGAISTEALYMTAERFESDSPRAAILLKKSSYVDDIIDSVRDKESAVKLTTEAEAMLLKGGFKIKFWSYSGDIPKNDEDGEVIRVLGVGWNHVKDTICFKAALNFSPKRGGAHVNNDLMMCDVPEMIPATLTRRMVLSQVMKIYDPLGLLSPFTLQAKVFLRETWSLKLSWDDPLPEDMRNKWVRFFTLLYEVDINEYPRCLRPENAVGNPWLVILSDGSDVAYGFAAFARWELSNGQHECNLIMAKCRIAPLNKVSTPKMELNGAVLSKRGRKMIETEMRYTFDKTVQIVDSKTVLGMINKISTRFDTYYGVRLGEIQSAYDGDVSSWAWVPGEENTADWVTRAKDPSQLGPTSEWWKGPPFMSQPYDEWGIEHVVTADGPFPGEKRIHRVKESNSSYSKPKDRFRKLNSLLWTDRSEQDNHSSSVIIDDKKESNSNASEPPNMLRLIDYSRFGRLRNLLWTVARVIQIIRKGSFKGGHEDNIKPLNLIEAEEIIIKDVQKSMTKELLKSDRKGRSGGAYSTLHPIMNSNGLWVIGSRLSFNPMTMNDEPQKLLHSDHYVTRLLMLDAHRSTCHRGRDSTVSHFRHKYWTPSATKLAWSVRQNCPLCKKRDHILMTQQMGPVPAVRLKPAPPFSSTMVDIFGPFSVRGEVQKRTTGKAYGIIFTDMVMRAVHIEAAFGYDTSSFLLALTRFVSIRGYPSDIYSDPGSQLVGAERELQEAWLKMDKSQITKVGTDKGMQWHFGPADSPWYQGAVESLIKGVKRSMIISVGKSRLSPAEFLTLCTEVANIMNERPVGIMPGSDSPINLFTPNLLLIGRCTAKNPGGWQPDCGALIKRYEVVQSICQEFWRHWRQLYAPTLVWDKKWHTATRNLEVGDIVLMSDTNCFKGEYKLAAVRQVFPSTDGLVRRVSVAYKNFKIGESVYEYAGAPDVLVTRSVQKLSLLVPIQDMDPA